jgi:nicotinamidase-related amidase
MEPTPVPDTLNILVVVDVQDCFMSNLLNNYNFLNLGVGSEVTKKLELSARMVKNIAELDKNSNLTIFTRDMHPINHVSFEGDEGRPPNPPNGYWPHHCRTEKQCDNRTDVDDIEGNVREPNNKLEENVGNIVTKNPDITKTFDSISLSDEYKNLPVKGNQLSYFFYFTRLASIVKQLNKPGLHVISLKPDIKPDTDPNFGQLRYNGITAIDNKYYSLWKGERCNYESYSAFNYHLEYDVNPGDDNLIDWNNAQKPIAILESNANESEYKYSTGLFEFIIAYVKSNSNYTKINFNICGLVGDVCVMHTAIQGSLLWKKIYSTMLPDVTCNFNVELAASAFLGPGGYKPTQAGYYADLPNKNKPAALIEYNAFYEAETTPYYDDTVTPEYKPEYKFVLNGEPAENAVTDAENAVAEVVENKGGKRTRRNRKHSTHKKHTSKCNCRLCLCSGKKRTLKKRKQSKRK